MNSNSYCRELGKGLKFLMLTLVLTALVFTAQGITAWADTSDDVKVTIDGENVKFTSELGQPFIDENSRTQVPLRAVMEAFDCNVDWDNDARIASVKSGSTEVKVPIDARYILVNDRVVENDTAAVIINDRTYLPIRAVLEAFGAGVAWDNDKRTVIVNSDGTVADTGTQNGGGSQTADNEEMHAMWISYLEYMNMLKTEDSFKEEICDMFDRCREVGMNAVIVHVRSHCDAMYPSKYYPWSLFATGTQGVDPGFDPLELMIEEAHKRGLEFHAWLNPYRVTGYGTYWNQVSSDNPVKVWLSDSDSSNDRWALKQKGEYYLNPSVPEVQQMVINGVAEIVKNYDVDGIHFDDYFYPSVSNTDPELWFDKPEYDKSGSLLDIADWRRNNVNTLVKGVYKAIKDIDEDVVFGISPAGNLSNLRSSSNHFVDIDKWFGTEGYADYIMPQLYWGFETRDSSGNIASYAYGNNLNSWLKLSQNSPVKLYVGLDMANAGTNVADRNEVSEWLRYNDIIARQVVMAREKGDVKGYAYFRYEHFNKTTSKGEVENLVKVIKQN